VIRILVLCAVEPDEPLRRCTGQSRFLGEAGLALADRGVDLICGAPGEDEGHRPVPGAWESLVIPAVDAVYDRSHDPLRRSQSRWEDQGVPVFNPPSFSALCDDKLAFAEYATAAGLPVPRTVRADDPAWRTWERAFAKPRYGGRGRGVRPIRSTDTLDGGVVQQGVEAVSSGQALRVLMQREEDGRWISAGMMDRRSPDGSAVVSLSCGATATPADGATTRALAPLVATIADALDGLPDAGRIVEVGVDVILGHDGPRVLEWNARPGRSFDRIGRADLRAAAVTRPFDWIVGSIARR